MRDNHFQSCKLKLPGIRLSSGSALSPHPTNVYIFFMSNKKPQESPNKSQNHSSKKDSQTGKINNMNLGGTALESYLLNSHPLSVRCIQVTMQASAILCRQHIFFSFIYFSLKRHSDILHYKICNS